MKTTVVPTKLYELQLGPKVLNHQVYLSVDYAAPLPFANVDPHRTGTDFTIERNLSVF